MGWEPGILNGEGLKPKGMHWRTFERAMERIDRAEGIVDGHTVLLLDRLNRITSR